MSCCQAIDVQLGLAIDSPKATLAVKRRLACEMVKCWQQVRIDSISMLVLSCIFFGCVCPGYAEARECFLKVLYQLDVKNLEN